MLFSPFAVLQLLFQTFFITAGKPHLGLVVTVLAGIANIFFDFLFIVVIPLGVKGAAYGTAIGYCIPAIFGLIFFSLDRNGSLRFVKPTFDAPILAHICANGSSELMTNLSSSIVNSLYNIQLMKFVGQDGVAAYGTIMYVNFVFLAIFFGYSIGSAPIVSYHYGAGNHPELKNLFKKSLTLISSWGILLLVLSQLLAHPLSSLFVGYDADLLAMTEHGFRIYALMYLIAGFNIFGSSFFTALNNGGVSAAISFLRTLLFQIAAVLLLPMIFDIDGIWIAISVAELLTLCVTATFLITQRKKYHYA